MLRNPCISSFWRESPATVINLLIQTGFIVSLMKTFSLGKTDIRWLIAVTGIEKIGQPTGFNL